MFHTPGTSRKSRTNRKRMQQEYDARWEDRLPREDKPQRYKKLGLPLVLAPFALMFCGGCVVTAPVSTLVVALLLGIVLLGDVIVPTRHSYYVVYTVTPTWLVGESASAAVSRREQKDTSAYAERYPLEYAGRIHSVIPITKCVPTYCDKLMQYTELSLTRSEVGQCNRLELKVVDDALVSTSIQDQLGAVYDTLAAEYTDAEIRIALSPDSEKTRDVVSIETAYDTALKALPQNEAHTGTGLYAVKVAPTNESEVQDGAVAGQVVTIVGTVAASPAFTGGYITNTNQVETRAIVSHTANTATMEGDISGWGDGNTLEWYDSWTTIAGATAQLVTDQGPAEYTLTQTIELYDGTYTEAVTVTTMAPKAGYPLIFTAASGETAVDWDNDGEAASHLTINNTENIFFYDFTFTMVDAAICISNTSAAGFIGNNMHWDASGGAGVLRGVRTNRGIVEDCQFTDCTAAIYLALVMYCFNCTFTGGTYGLEQNAGPFVWSARGCVFDGVTYPALTSNQNYVPGVYEFACEFINCTLYNGTHGLYIAGESGGRAAQFRMYNNIFHTFTNAFYAASDCPKGRVDSDYNIFYNCTNIADIDGTTYNLANWQAWTDQRGISPDANSGTSNPGVADPGADDWSLTAASISRHAGIGAYASCRTGINAVAFDKWHPDKGAWSSGPGPNVSYGT